MNVIKAVKGEKDCTIKNLVTDNLEAFCFFKKINFFFIFKNLNDAIYSPAKFYFEREIFFEWIESFSD